jgi:hypothetical protein
VPPLRQPVKRIIWFHCDATGADGRDYERAWIGEPEALQDKQAGAGNCLASAVRTKLLWSAAELAADADQRPGGRPARS